MNEVYVQYKTNAGAVGITAAGPLARFFGVTRFGVLKHGILYAISAAVDVDAGPAHVAAQTQIALSSWMWARTQAIPRWWACSKTPAAAAFCPVS